jgi:undecaprenyl-phosphate galactose phosphotransferase
MNASSSTRIGGDIGPSEQLTLAGGFPGWRGARAINRHICTVAMVASDVSACVLTFGFASLLNWELLPTLPNNAIPQQSAGAFAIVVVALLVWLASQSHYHRRIPFWTELQHLVTGACGALLCSGFLMFLMHDTPSRALLLTTWSLLAVLIVVMRGTTRRLLKRGGFWQIRTLIVGDGEAVPQTITALSSEPGLGYDVTRVMRPQDVQTDGEATCWRSLLQQQHADLLVLAPDRDQLPSPGLIDSLVRQRVPFAMVPPSAGLPVLGFERTCFFSHDTVIFLYRNNLARPVARITKIILDLVLVSCALVVLSPLLLLIAAAVKLDGGPVFFAHPRIGARGRLFHCLKFRSMVTNSAEALQHVLATDREAAAEWAATQKLRHDPRVTRVGRLLRKTSLDELPQLFNVLRLDMSLVGPRPIVTKEVDRYGDDIAFYYETRPGITGLWQVSGRNTTSYSHRVQLDTWYVKNWTIWHDVAILAKTIPAVLQRRGAY